MVGMLFKVCKAAPVVKDWTLWLSLPFGSAEWECLAFTRKDGTEMDLHEAFLPLSTEGETKAVIPYAPQDVSEEERVRRYLREHGSAKTSDIEELLNCKETKARGLLQKLEKDGDVKRSGEGRATVYKMEKGTGQDS